MDYDGSQNSHRHINNLLSEIDFMNDMIRSLSVYSKINLPNFSLNKTSVSPSTLINEIYHRYTDIVARNGLSLTKHTRDPVVSVMLDREQITRVLINLMDNALKNCRSNGEISIGIKNNNGKPCFFVADTGDGIPESMADEIFEPPFRTDPSRNRDTGGLGLGLAICKKIIELHGGEIYYSRENGKTIFSFTV